MKSMFGHIRVENLDLSNFDTSKVTEMGAVFSGCGRLESLDLGNFDTSKVINMEEMFYECTNLKSLNISNFDISNLEDTYLMFLKCKNLTTIYTPKKSGKTKVRLSTGAWTDNAGNVYKELPKNATESIVLTNLKNSVQNNE